MPVSKLRKKPRLKLHNTPPKMYRVQRSDGVILVRQQRKENAEEIAKALYNNNPQFIYRVTLDSGPVVNIRDYLNQK